MLKKILLVEDDKNISEMVREYLQSNDCIVYPVFDGNEALKVFKPNFFDLVLLDLMILKLDGISVLKNIREYDFTPIIIMTAKDSDIDKVMGLGLGADDYITKPFSLIELLARITANIRRVTNYKSNVIEDRVLIIKDIEINIDKYCIYKDGEKINLTNKEFEILKLLVINRGRVFSKEQIYNSIWGEQYYGDENVINVHMKRLRDKIGCQKNGEEYIKTLWGIGYKVEEE